MVRTRYSLPKLQALAHGAQETVSTAPTQLRYSRYDDNKLEEFKITSVDEIPDPTPGGPVLWVEVDGLRDTGLLQALGDRFGLHPLALEDVLNLGQRPKVEPYETHLFIVLQMMSMQDGNEIAREQVALFLGPGFLISIEEVPLTEVVLSMQKSSLAFEATLQVRNKVMKAYEEIMNMPV